MAFSTSVQVHDVCTVAGVVVFVVFESQARSSVGSTQRRPTAISTAEYLADGPFVLIVSEDKPSGADLGGL